MPVNPALSGQEIAVGLFHGGKNLPTRAIMEPGKSGAPASGIRHAQALTRQIRAQAFHLARE